MAPLTYLAFVLALVSASLAAPVSSSPDTLEKRVTHSGRVRIEFLLSLFPEI